MPNRTAIWAAIASALTWQGHAATITVDDAQDNQLTNGLCSLREAIAAAASQAAQDGCAMGDGDDVIVFAPSVSAIQLGSPLTVSGNLTIDGGNTVAINPPAGQNAFNGSPQHFQLHNITLSSAIGSGAGVAINSGTLTVSNSTITGLSPAIDVSRTTVSIASSQFSQCQSTGRGGALRVQYGELSVIDSQFADNQALSGGAIYTYYSDFYARSSTLTGNTAAGAGGAVASVFGGFNGIALTLEGNSASGGGGININNPTDVTITNSTISGNSAVVGGGIYLVEGRGAAINISDTDFTGNSATSYGGGLQITNLSPPFSTATISGGQLTGNAAGEGSAIRFENGGLNLDGVDVSNNLGSPYDGAVQLRNTTATISQSTFQANEGNAILSDANSTLNLLDSTISDHANLVVPTIRSEGDFYGAGLVIARNSIEQGQGGGLSHDGGGIGVSTFTLRNSQLYANTVGGTPFARGAGALLVANADFSIESTRLDGNSTQLIGGALLVTSAVGDLVDVDASANTAALRGGAVALINSNVTITNSMLSGNTATDCGAVQTSGGTLTATALTASDNWSPGEGGALCLNLNTTINDSVISNNRSGGRGGGLVTTDTLAINGSTIYGNRAGGNGGGGIYAAAASTVTVTNSTISENLAARGAAITTEPGSTLSFDHATVADNGPAEGVAIAGDGAVEFTNTVVSNPGVNCEMPQAKGLPTLNGINHFSDDSCGAPGSGDPLLTAVANQGGPTPSQHPRAGSPLLDGADSGVCLPGDQRGFPRNAMSCDVGSVEAQSPNDPPFIDDLQAILEPPFVQGQLVAMLTFGDAENALPPGSVSIVRGDPQFSLTAEGVIELTGPMTSVGVFPLRVEVTDPDGASDRATALVVLGDEILGDGFEE